MIKKIDYKLSARGFTLLELLAIVAILGVLLLILVPSTFNILRTAKNNSYNTMVDTIENSAKLYVEKNWKDVEPIILATGVYEMTLEQLSDLGLLKENLVNPKTNEIVLPSKKVKVMYDDDGALFYCYEDKDCPNSHYDPIAPPGPPPLVETDPVITILGSNPAQINVGSVYNDAGATAWDDNDGNITNNINIVNLVNRNQVGTYTVTYTVQNSIYRTDTKTRTVYVVDSNAPTVVFGTNGNTTYAKSRSTTVTVSDTDGVDASSLKYLWNTSTTQPTEGTFSTTFVNTQTISSPAGVSGGYYLWILAKDNSGNMTIVRTNVFNLDNAAPTCTTSGGSSSWTNGNRTITGTCSDTGGSGCTGNASTTYSSNTNTTTASPGTVYDNAGNSTACPANQTVKIDKTAPTCTSSGGSATWTYNDRTITGTCSDTGGSGCTGNVTKTYSSNTNTTTASPGTVYDYAGNSVVCPADRTVKIDKTAPTCTSSGGSSTWTTGSRTITGNCSDTGGSNCTGNSSNTFSTSTNTTSAGPGSVYDNAGNYAGCPNDQTVKVDKTFPSVTYTPNGKTTCTTTSPSASVSVSDTYSGVYTRYYLWNQSTTQPSASSIITSFSNGATLTAGSNRGYWYLWIRSTDNAGNQTIVRSNSFCRDP